VEYIELSTLFGYGPTSYEFTLSCLT
jgi:hypothetical protein